MKYWTGLMAGGALVVLAACGGEGDAKTETADHGVAVVSEQAPSASQRQDFLTLCKGGGQGDPACTCMGDMLKRELTGEEFGKFLSDAKADGSLTAGVNGLLNRTKSLLISQEMGDCTGEP